MGTVRDPRAAQDVMLDTDAELRHWRGCYRQCSFHRRTREFDDYIPTLKFAYDAYLLHYRTDLDEQLDTLESAYARSVPQWQQLEWPQAQAILREVWGRMKSGLAWRTLTPLRTPQPLSRTLAAHA